MARVVHFEIHAQDPERAVRFYEGVFGWSAGRWGSEEYWLLTTGSAEERGIDGAILRRRGAPPAAGAPVSGYVCTVEVDDLDRYLASATDAGGTVAVPKLAVKGVGWLAYCHDPEGNIFGLMQPDSEAA